MAEPGREPARGGPRLLVDARPFDRAAVLVAEATLAVLESRATARLAIPGGSAIEAVAGARDRLGARWGSVWLTWVDERCVPSADDASNRGLVERRGLLDAAPDRSDRPAPARVLPLFEDGESPAAAVERVGAAWTDAFAAGLDVVLLGMGPDGHVASLFPETSSMPVEGWVAHVSDSPKPPASRITLTRAALATAPHVVLVAAGESKRAALARLVAGDPALPASGLAGLVVVTDVEGVDRA